MCSWLKADAVKVSEDLQPTGACRTFKQRFSATPRGARLARLLTAHQLDAWGLPRGVRLHDEVLLVVAELAANAVVHGRVPGRDFAVRLEYADDVAGVPTSVRIEVCDPHPALPARLAVPADPLEETYGRGLLLVEAYARDWGVRARPGPGKTVWALCTAPTPRPT